MGVGVGSIPIMMVLLVWYNLSELLPRISSFVAPENDEVSCYLQFITRNLSGKNHAFQATSLKNYRVCQQSMLFFSIKNSVYSSCWKHFFGQGKRRIHMHYLYIYNILYIWWSAQSKLLRIVNRKDIGNKLLFWPLIGRIFVSLIIDILCHFVSVQTVGRTPVCPHMAKLCIAAQ